MIQSPDNKEQLILTSASEVRIVAHPLYRISAIIEPSYNTARLNQLDYFSKTYGATTQREAVLISLFYGSVKGPFGKSIGEKGPDLPDAYDAVHVLKDASTYPKNVITIPDLVESGETDPHIIEEALRQNGLQITDSTIVTLAGEEVDECLISVADKLRQLPSITSFRLDKKGVLASGYITNPPNEAKIRDNLDTFIRFMKPWDVSEDDQYISVSRPRS